MVRAEGLGWAELLQSPARSWGASGHWAVCCCDWDFAAGNLCCGQREHASPSASFSPCIAASGWISGTTMVRSGLQPGTQRTSTCFHKQAHLWLGGLQGRACPACLSGGFARAAASCWSLGGTKGKGLTCTRVLRCRQAVRPRHPVCCPEMVGGRLRWV